MDSGSKTPGDERHWPQRRSDVVTRKTVTEPGAERTDPPCRDFSSLVASAIVAEFPPSRQTSPTLLLCGSPSVVCSFFC